MSYKVSVTISRAHGPAPVDVSEQGTTQMDLALTVGRAPDLPAAWPRRVPEHMATASSLPEGHGKEIIMTRCTGCHSETSVISRRVDRETWESTITEMRGEMVGVDLPDLSEEEVTVLLDYLTANLPPMPAPDPNSRLLRTLMQGEAANYRVVQYDVENEGVENHDVAVDPGALAGPTSVRGARSAVSIPSPTNTAKSARLCTRPSAHVQAICRSARTASCGWPIPSKRAG